MQRFNEDCFYFLTSTCTKGGSCPYRHNPAAVHNQMICSAWIQGTCTDAGCLLRHSNVPIARSAIPATATCFFETTPKGCLKHDCPFIHVRPRLNMRNPMVPRPITTSLVNKEISKPTASVAPIKPSDPIPEKVMVTPREIVNEISDPPVKTENVQQERIETPVTRNVIVPEPKEKPAVEKKTNGNLPARVVVNRSVVVAEANSKPNRTIVISSDNVKHVGKEESKIKQASTDSDSDLDDLLHNETPLPKQTGNLDISFPCSTNSMTGRLFLTTKISAPITISNGQSDTKPIRLRRDPLPATTTTTPLNTNNDQTANGKKISSGTDVTDEEERRNKRLQRFKAKPNSPPSPPPPLISTNERKRPSDKHARDDSRPSKRISLASPQKDNIGQRRSGTIVDNGSPSSSNPGPQSKASCISDAAWREEVELFLAKTASTKKGTSPMIQPLTSNTNSQTSQAPPLRAKPSKPAIATPRVATTTTSTIPATLVATSKQTNNSDTVLVSKEMVAPTTTSVSASPVKETSSSIKKPGPTATTTVDEYEDELLELHAPTEMGDPFALIDEALFETELLELS